MRGGERVRRRSERWAVRRTCKKGGWGVSWGFWDGGARLGRKERGWV